MGKNTCPKQSTVLVRTFRINLVFFSLYQIIVINNYSSAAQSQVAHFVFQNGGKKFYVIVGKNIYDSSLTLMYFNALEVFLRYFNVLKAWYTLLVIRTFCKFKDITYLCKINYMYTLRLYLFLLTQPLSCCCFLCFLHKIFLRAVRICSF